MIITTKGGIGTPENPHNPYSPKHNPGSDFSQFDDLSRDNPPLPVYYNGSQFMGEIRGEAEIQNQWQDFHDPSMQWFDDTLYQNVPHVLFRKVYVLKSDQITQPGEKGEDIRIPDLNIREFNISFFNDDLIIYENGSELVEFSKSETLKLRDFLNQLPI